MSPADSRDVTVEVDGPGVLQALGTAESNANEPLTDNSRLSHLGPTPIARPSEELMRSAFVRPRGRPVLARRRVVGAASAEAIGERLGLPTVRMASALLTCSARSPPFRRAMRRSKKLGRIAHQR